MLNSGSWVPQAENVYAANLNESAARESAPDTISAEQADVAASQQSVAAETPFGRRVGAEPDYSSTPAVNPADSEPKTIDELRRRQKDFYHDPAYDMPFDEWQEYTKWDRENSGAVEGFLEGLSGAPQALGQLGFNLAKERGQQYLRAMTGDPMGALDTEVATFKEMGRKVGVGLTQFVDWVGGKTNDMVASGRRVGQKQAQIVAALREDGKLTGDPMQDNDTIRAAMEEAAAQGMFDDSQNEQADDEQTQYQRYLRQKQYDRDYAGISEYSLGGNRVTLPEVKQSFANPITGNVAQPQEATATAASMVFDPINAVPIGAGALSKVRILRRLASVTGTPLKYAEQLGASADSWLMRQGDKITSKIPLVGDLPLGQRAAVLAGAAGVGAYVDSKTDGGLSLVTTPLMVAGGILPALKASGTILRKTGASGGAGWQIIKEMDAGGIGAARAATAERMASSGAFGQFSQYMRPGASGVESSLRRVSMNPDAPETLRRVARSADNIGITQVARAADDLVSSSLVAGATAVPFALVAPDEQTAGQIVGGAMNLGGALGTAGRFLGRRSARADADISRMLVDVEMAGGDAKSLLSLDHASLDWLSAQQGMTQGKVDVIPLRAQEYRANVDIKASGAETVAGLHLDRTADGRAKIYVNMGHTAPIAGRVSIKEVDITRNGKTEKASVVRIKGEDGKSDFTVVPKEYPLLVKSGDTVSESAHLARGLSPRKILPHEIGHAILTSNILDGAIRDDMRNLVNQQYGADGIEVRGREYVTRLVDRDILAGAHDSLPDKMTRQEFDDIAAGKVTMADVVKGKPLSDAERTRLINERMEEMREQSRSSGNNQDGLDVFRDEVVAETFSSLSQSIDFRNMRTGGPRVMESVYNGMTRMFETLGLNFDQSTGKLLDSPSVIFRDSPLTKDPVMRKRLQEHLRNYEALMVNMEQAGQRKQRGTAVSSDGTAESARRSTHTKLRPNDNGILENDIVFIDQNGNAQWKPQDMLDEQERGRASQVMFLYEKDKILPANSKEFGRRRAADGRILISGPTLPAKFDALRWFPRWLRPNKSTGDIGLARTLEASREEGMSYIFDVNVIGSGESGRYRVKNRGDIRAVIREGAFIGWQATKNHHLNAVVLDLNAFRSSAMKAINGGKLGVFNNDMTQLQADLMQYMGNHKNGLPGEAGIGIEKRDLLNGLIGTGTAVQRAANPLYADLNPRGSIRTFRVDRLNDAQPTGRTGYHIDYDKINANRMPQQIPRGAQGMPDAVETLTTDQLQRQYEENQGYLGLSTLGMREGRPVRGGAAQTRELLRRNDAISAELQRRGAREEDPQLQQALQRRGQAMPDAEARSGAVETLEQLKRSQFIPTKVAAEVVGGFPEYLRPVAQFITDQRQKLANGQMTRRDVMKAYAMTIASQGSGARAVEVIANNVAKDGVRFRPSKDFTTADKKGRAAIRPEEAAAYWLGTDAGQKALDNFEAGRFSPDDWKELVAIRKAYGDDRFNNLGAFNPDNIRTMDKVLADLNASRADTGRVMDAVQQLRGIKTGKKGFIAHLLGIGDVPTIDAVEINFWLTGKADIGKLNTRKATLARSVKESISDRRVSQEMFRRIDQRINALRDEVPGGASISQEVWSHVMHHWLWDKSKGIETTHEGMYRAQAQFMPDVVVKDEGGTVWKEVQDAPIVSLKDFEGRPVFAAFADLTSAGKIYRGIDSSEIAVPVETHGGPEWPLIQDEVVGKETDVWTNQGAGVSAMKARRANEGAIMLVAAMDKNAHVSNTETATAVIATNAAYARDGRITPENLAALDNSIRKEIEDFPGIESPSIMEYVNKLPFQGAKSRARIAEILESKKSQDLGAPNVQRILDEMRSDQYDGLRIGDIVLAIELTPGAPVVKLGEQGTMVHPSYQYAVRGRVIGRFARPINIASVFDDFYAKRRAEGKPELGDRRAFDLAKPVQVITPAIAARIPGTPYNSFRSPRHAQVINMAKDDRWRSSEQTVKAGGVSPAAFIDALNASPAKLALDRYTLKGLQEKLETGAMSIYQLGNAQVFFGIKQGDPASSYGQNPAAFGFGPNEKTLSLVLNNERKTGGMADAIVIKSLQLGVTALDCFAVKSKKNPTGMLPELYENYGFESVGSLPFDPQFYSKTELADLKKYWKSTGWDEGLGLPEIVLMKWKGNNELRTKSLREFAAENSASVQEAAGGRELYTDTRKLTERNAGKGGKAKRRAGQGDAGPGAGNQGDAGRGVQLSRGFLGAYDELLSMSPDELRNLGIK